MPPQTRMKEAEGDPGCISTGEDYMECFVEDPDGQLQSERFCQDESWPIEGRSLNYMTNPGRDNPNMDESNNTTMRQAPARNEYILFTFVR